MQMPVLWLLCAACASRTRSWGGTFCSEAVGCGPWHDSVGGILRLRGPGRGSRVEGRFGRWWPRGHRAFRVLQRGARLDRQGRAAVVLAPSPGGQLLLLSLGRGSFGRSASPSLWTTRQRGVLRLLGVGTGREPRTSRGVMKSTIHGIQTCSCRCRVLHQLRTRVGHTCVACRPRMIYRADHASTRTVPSPWPAPGHERDCRTGATPNVCFCPGGRDGRCRRRGGAHACSLVAAGRGVRAARAHRR